MESPSSWGPLEHAISAAFDEWYKEKQQLCKTSSSMPVRLDSNMTNALLTFITRSRVTDEP